jgi:hypothetical protein
VHINLSHPDCFPARVKGKSQYGVGLRLTVVIDIDLLKIRYCNTLENL